MSKDICLEPTADEIDKFISSSSELKINPYASQVAIQILRKQRIMEALKDASTFNDLKNILLQVTDMYL